MAKRKGVPLKTYPPISFKITIKGVEEMNYRIEEKPSFRIVGLREAITNDAEEAFKCVPLFWQKAAPRIPQILSLMSGEPKGLLGVSTCNEVEGKQNYYYIAVASDKPISDGMSEETVPASTWAVFPGGGTQEDIQALQVRVVSEWLPTSGYEWANAPDVEIYLDNDPQNMQFEIWLPVVKKQ
jgi:AraC family transcriptional regulator